MSDSESSCDFEDCDDFDTMLENFNEIKAAQAKNSESLALLKSYINAIGDTLDPEKISLKESIKEFLEEDRETRESTLQEAHVTLNNCKVDETTATALLLKFFSCTEQDAQFLSKELFDYYNSHTGISSSCSYSSFLYEVLGYLYKDFYATVQDMKNDALVEWDSSVFQECKDDRRSALSKVMFKPVAIKGLDFCFKCKGDEFTYWQAQTRGNDEQTTTFKRCIKCNF